MCIFQGIKKHIVAIEFKEHNYTNKTSIYIYIYMKEADLCDIFIHSIVNQ